MRGQADRTHLGTARAAGFEAQDDTDELIVARNREIASARRGRVTPAQEVQIVPGPIVEILGYRQLLRGGLGTVDERRPDVAFGDGFQVASTPSVGLTNRGNVTAAKESGATGFPGRPADDPVAELTCGA